MVIIIIEIVIYKNIYIIIIIVIIIIEIVIYNIIIMVIIIIVKILLNFFHLRWIWVLCSKIVKLYIKIYKI